MLLHPYPQSHLPKHPRKKLFHLSHVLLHIRFQMSCPRLPIVGGITHTAGEEDEFVGINRWEDTIFGIATDHPESIDEHSDEEIGLTEGLAVLPRHNAAIDESSQRLHGV